MPTTNYNLNTPSKGTTDWHTPLNENFESIDSILDRVETNSGSTSGVRYASSFSGVNGGEMIQSAIDDLPASGGTVMVGPESPDDLTGLSDNLRPYGWAVSSQISIPDAVSVILKDAYVALTTGSPEVNIFQNAANASGDSKRNSNIAVVGSGMGTIIDGNPHEVVGTEDGEPGEVPVHFNKVDRLHLGGYQIRGVGFAHLVQNFNHLRAENIYLRDTNRDGLHMLGPWTDAHVKSIHGSARDDGVGVNADSGTLFDRGPTRGGVAQNATIHDIHFADLDSGEPIRLINSGQTLENINISGVVNTGGQTAIGIGSAGTPSSLNGLRNVTVNGVISDRSGVVQRGGVQALSISNVVSKGQVYNNNKNDARSISIVSCQQSSTGNSPGITFNSGTIEEVSIQGYQTTRTRQNKTGNPAIWILNEPTISDVRASGLVFRDQVAGIQIESGAVLRDVRFETPAFTNVTYPYNNSDDSGRFGVTQGVLINDTAPYAGRGGDVIYTGHGTAERSITLGFRPKYVCIEKPNGNRYDTHDVFGPGYQFQSANSDLSTRDDGFITGNESADLNLRETYVAYYEV